MPRRSHPLAPAPFRGVVAVAAAVILAFVAAACNPAPALLSDPREILDAAVAHLRAARSLHVEVGFEGSLALGALLGGPQASGSALGLTGTHLEGDLDLAGERAVVRFQVPALLGLEGELRQLGSETYVESSLTSRGWHRLTGIDLPAFAARPNEWLAALAAWLDQPSALPLRLDDSSCRSGTCYVVRVVASPHDLEALASSAPELATALTGGTVAVELRIDRTSLVVSEAVLRIDLGPSGTIVISATFSGWDADVRIEAPAPSDIVTGPLLP